MTTAKSIHSPSTARLTSIEALRLISIYLIVLSHCCVHTAWGEGIGLFRSVILGSLSLGEVGVTCFVLITGYFLWNKPFRFSRLIRTVVPVFTYSIICFIISACLGNDMTLSWRNVLFPTLSGTYWFITAYVGLILFHPFVNLIISSLTNHSLRSLLVLQFALFAVVPFLTQTNFLFSNLSYFIFLYMLGAYFARRGEVGRDGITIYVVALIGAFLLFVLATLMSIEAPDILASVGINRNSLLAVNSPFALIMGSSLFLIFIHLRVSQHAFINKIANSALGVYLLTDSPFIRGVLWGGLLTLANQLLPNAISHSTIELAFYLAIVPFLVTCVSLIIDSIKRALIDAPLIKLVNSVLTRFQPCLDSEFGIWD